MVWAGNDIGGDENPPAYPVMNVYVDEPAHSYNGRLVALDQLKSQRDNQRALLELLANKDASQLKSLSSLVGTNSHSSFVETSDSVAPQINVLMEPASVPGQYVRTGSSVLADLVRSQEAELADVTHFAQTPKSVILNGQRMHRKDTSFVENYIEPNPSPYQEINVHMEAQPQRTGQSFASSFAHVNDRAASDEKIFDEVNRSQATLLRALRR